MPKQKPIRPNDANDPREVHARRMRMIYAQLALAEAVITEEFRSCNPSDDSNNSNRPNH